MLDSRNRSLGRRRLEAETAKKSLFVILSFFIFTVPYPLTVMLERTSDLFQQKTKLYELQYAFNALNVLSSGLNPLVYGLANQQFRAAFSRTCRLYYRRYRHEYI